MDDDIQEKLLVLESRVAALEAQELGEDRTEKTGCEDASFPGAGFVWIPVPIAVFAWLSGGSAAAWFAVGAIGVCCILAAFALSVRQK